MGGVSADGNVLWLTGRYDSEVYAIDTKQRKTHCEDCRRQGPSRLVRLSPVWPLLTGTYWRVPLGSDRSLFPLRSLLSRPGSVPEFCRIR